MRKAVTELASALERVAAAMDAESEAVRAGQTTAISAAAARKRAVLETAEPVLRRFSEVTGHASPAERADLVREARRMQKKPPPDLRQRIVEFHGGRARK